MTVEDQIRRRVVSLGAERGAAFTRTAIALALSKDSRRQAAEIARERWPDTPGVAAHLEKAAVTSFDSSDGTSLVPGAAAFLALIRADEVIGRLPRLRRVPFNRGRALQTGGATLAWLPESGATPVGKATLTDASLPVRKNGGIVILSEEIARSSSPAAESIISQDLRSAVTAFSDAAFLSTTAAVAGTSPAGLLDGVTPTAATADPIADLRTLLSGFTTLKNVSVIMSPANAVVFATAVSGGLGALTFDGGPTFAVSDAAGDYLVAIDQSRVLLAEGGIILDTSGDAAVQMDDAPSSGAASLVSLWQLNLVGLKVIRFINWRAESGAVAAISGTSY